MHGGPKRATSVEMDRMVQKAQKLTGNRYERVELKLKLELNWSESPTR